MGNPASCTKRQHDFDENKHTKVFHAQGYCNIAMFFQREPVVADRAQDSYVGSAEEEEEEEEEDHGLAMRVSKREEEEEQESDSLTS